MIRRIVLVALATALLGACAPKPAPKADHTFDGFAEEYVKLSLRIGQKEEGYIDAYYGNPAWQQEAEARCGPKAPDPEACSHKALSDEAKDLQARIAAYTAAEYDKLGDDDHARSAFLSAQLKAADTRLRMMQGEKLSFEDEAEGLFGVRPVLKPLGDYDQHLAKIEALVPGDGPLWQRVDSFHDRFVVPSDRLKAVMDAAIAECRKRTMAHIPLPANERFTLEFVTGKSWSGYNWYKGDATSLIQVNTDLPVRLSRAVDLGCHEGYPGHHVLNLLLEERLSKGKGWVEFTVYPLFSPQSLIAEGSANYGIDLAFPGEERLKFETEVLYPLAGLDPKDAGRYLELQEAQKALSGARFTIASEYLAGRLTREQAIEATQKYSLVSRKRAEQSISFTEQYRSYVINYGLGLDMVRAYVEREGQDPAVKWKRMDWVIGGPTLPGDLLE